MRTTTAGLLALLLVPFVLAPAIADEKAPFAFERDTLPDGWEIANGVTVDAKQLPAFSGRLGGTIASLTNQVVSVGGFQVRVNLLVAADAKAADAIQATMLSMRGKDYLRRRDRRVYEVAGNNLLVARRVFAALGFDADAKAIWKVRFRIALVDALDQAAGNRVFNHFLALEKNPDDEKAKAAIRAETKGWTTGRTLRLVRSTPGLVDAKWTLHPAPSASEEVPFGTVYRFEDPPVSEGLPYVDVEGTVVVPARFTPTRPTGGLGGVLGLTAATASWPAGAEVIRKAAAAAVEGAKDDRARVRALLRETNRLVRYGGAMGTRDGVLAVLERGVGRCWDKSDVFVTLCRAAKIGARQVAGWVPSVGAGHIWAEVHVDGAWLPVDATTTWLGAGVDYIPFFQTLDGPMPIVYLGMPRIERVE